MCCSMQLAHVVAVGVPLQVCAEWKTWGGEGAWSALGQQIWPGQSLLEVQLFAQVPAQMPLQQRVADPDVQSADVVQALGHAVCVVLRQTPCTPSAGSRMVAVVQQVSPAEPLQSVSALQLVGHSLVAVQMGDL